MNEQSFNIAFILNGPLCIPADYYQKHELQTGIIKFSEQQFVHVTHFADGLVCGV